MATAFIIMQIGNSELDAVCRDAIVPALAACGLDAKRIDKHNQGGLLKSEIIQFIESSEIIVADLTNERPNCYLEVGYAMGVGKFRNLILTARSDHNADHPERKPNGPKVHFDLIGYEVLFWTPDDLAGFLSELKKRIRRRQSVLAADTSTRSDTALDTDWFKSVAADAQSRFPTLSTRGFLELRFRVESPKPKVSPRQLFEAASKASFGRIGAVRSREEYRPHPTAEGIVAEIKDDNSFNYWSLRVNGDFYLVQTLFEDGPRPQQNLLGINWRVGQVTEALLYCARLYTQLNVSSTQAVQIGIRHNGLKGRTLSWERSGYRDLEDEYKSAENEANATVFVQLSEVESRLVGLVEEVCEPLFMLFNFFEVRKETYSKLIDDVVSRRV